MSPGDLPIPSAGERPRHLLLFIHSLARGGAERVAAALLNEWVAQGWPATLLTLESAPLDAYPLDPRVRRETLDLADRSDSLIDAVWKNILRMRGLRDALARVQPDVIVSFMTTANILLALARWRWRGVALGAERVHPPAVPLGIVWHTLRRWSYGRLDGVVAQTERSSDWLCAHTSARLVRVIPNPVTWPLTGQGTTRAADRVRGRRRVLGAGRLEVQKGFDRLIDAFAAIDAPDWELVILGEGPYRVNLEARIARAGMGDRIRLPGAVANMGDWYDHADLFVLSSAFEGFPNVLVEAMAHGLASISFDCDTGPSDVIRDGENGLLIPPGDVAALREAMARLMNDSAARARLASRGTEVRDRFALRAVLNQWVQLAAELEQARGKE